MLVVSPFRKYGDLSALRRQPPERVRRTVTVTDEILGIIAQEKEGGVADAGRKITEMSSRRRRVRQPTSVMCECGRPAVVRKSLSASNPDREFFCCAKRFSRKEEEEEKGCDLFEWKDVRMATEKEKQRADAVVASLKMENVRLKEENCALKEDNNELRESVAQLLQGSGGSGNCKCHEQHCCCSAAKVEWDGVEARLTLLESILLAKD